MASTSITLTPLDSTEAQPGSAFTIIKTFLQNSSNPGDAATDLGRCLMDDSVIWIATQIPYDHPWQLRLASLLQALKNLPTPPRSVCEQICEFHCFPEFRWNWFPTFLVQQGELFNYKNRYSRNIREMGMIDCWSSEEWLNINKFCSLLVAEHIETSFAQDGLWVLRNTLEITRDLETLEDNIPSAAVWILTAGRWIHENRGLHLWSNLERLEENPHIEDYQGSDGLSDERWQYWEGKFKKLALRSDLKEGTRAWALSAEQYMARLT